MRIEKALILGLVYSSTWCYGQSSRGVGDKAIPADLSISCRMNASERTVEVKIVNHSEKRCYFRSAGAQVDYEVEVSTLTGERIPRPAPPTPTTGQSALSLSVGPVSLDPQGEHIETLSLSVFTEIPKQGGTFRVRIGRGLFSVWGNPFKLDPAQILWCKPINVTFPPLK